MLKKVVVFISAIVFSSIVFSTTAWAAGEFSAQGTVNAVKSADGKLNISHGDVKGLMGAMTMDFKVADPAMLDDVEAGSNINFTLEEDKKGNLTITDLEVTGSSSKNVASESHKH